MKMHIFLRISNLLFVLKLDKLLMLLLLIYCNFSESFVDVYLHGVNTLFDHLYKEQEIQNSLKLFKGARIITFFHALFVSHFAKTNFDNSKRCLKHRKMLNDPKTIEDKKKSKNKLETYFFNLLAKTDPKIEPYDVLFD